MASGRSPSDALTGANSSDPLAGKRAGVKDKWVNTGRKRKRSNSASKQAGSVPQKEGKKAQNNSGKDKGKGKQPQKAQQQDGRSKANDKKAQGKAKAKNDAKGASEKLLAEPPIPKSLVNPEVYATLNEMLHSASVLTMQSFMHGTFNVSNASEGKGTGEKERSEPDGNENLRAGKHLAMLARKRISDMKTLAKKSVISLDPSIKRMICKRCDTLLIPCITDETRVKPFKPHQRVIQHECRNCGFKRRLPAPPLGSRSSRRGAEESSQPSTSAAAAATQVAVEEQTIEMDSAMDPEIPVDAATREEVPSELPVEASSLHIRQRMPQRQRRKAGNLARLVAKRVEEETETLQEQGLLQVAGHRGKRGHGPDADNDSLLPEIFARKERLPDVLERGVSIAERRLVARRMIDPLRKRGRTPQPRIADLFDKIGNASKFYPTKNERRKIQAIERQYRLIARKGRAEEEAQAKLTGAGPSTLKTRQKRKRPRLPPFFERMKGSGWADHLSSSKKPVNTSADRTTSREERAARRYKGGHVMLQGR